MHWLIAGGLAYIAGLLLIQPTAVSLGLFSLILLGPLVILRPKWFFLLFIFIRPLLDAAGNFGGGGLATMFTLILLAVCGVNIAMYLKDFFNRQTTMMRWFNFWFLSLLLAAACSLLNAENRFVSLADLLRLSTVGLVFNYCMCYCDGKNDLSRIRNALIGSAAVILSVGLYQVLFRKGRLFEGFYRVYAVFLHPNVFAEYLFVLLCLGLYALFRKSPGASGRWRSGLSCLIIVLLVYATYTRGVWLAVAAAGVFLVASAERFSGKFVSSALGGIGLAALLPFLKERWSDVLRPDPYRVNSWEWRLQLWRETLGLIEKKPLIGHGIGMYQYNVGVMAHNDYLRICYEMGVFGLIAYLGMWATIAWSALAMLRQGRNYDERLRARLIFAIVLGLAVISAADNLARSTVVLLYALIAVAVLIRDRHAAYSSCADGLPSAGRCAAESDGDPWLAVPSVIPGGTR